MVSKYQTQAIELKNAIKNFTQNVSHFRGGGGALGKVRHVSLFARFFILDVPLGQQYVETQFTTIFIHLIVFLVDDLYRADKTETEND